MTVYRDGSPVELKIAYVDSDGVQVDPASAIYRVYDETDTEIVAPTAVAIETGDYSATINIPGENNLLNGVKRIIRFVELIITDEKGVKHEIVQHYIVEDKQILAEMDNTYQSYGDALLTAQEMSNLDYWTASDDDSRKRALIDAYDRLGKLRYVVTFENNIQSRLVRSDDIRYLNDLTVTDYADLPEKFRVALEKAQIAEANQILGDDGVEAAREEGLLSESVGESSQFYRSSKPVKLPVSQAAIRYLRGYMNHSMRLGRG